jgi:flavin-binding protein dodecin
MRKSDLKNEIKEYIYEILSEVTMVGPDTELSDIPSIAKSEKTNPATVKAAIDQAKKTKQAVSVAESDDEDREPTKAELAKEKVKTVSKFKISNSEFEDFKTKLKTLVKKIKDMDEGDERTKKMAALKQFIKKPELVKAFKERDVKIDTDGLVG